MRLVCPSYGDAISTRRFKFWVTQNVRCRSRIKICVTGLSVVRVTTFVVRRGWSRQRGNDNVDKPGNFVHGGSETSNIPVNKIV